MKTYKRFLATITLVLLCFYRSVSFVSVANHLGGVDTADALIMYISILIFETLNLVLITKVYLDIIEEE